MATDAPETEGLVLYSSSVAGSVTVEKQTDRVVHILTTHKIPFKQIDVSISQSDKEYMHQHTQHPIKHALPQLFLNGCYLGSADQLDEANEFGELKEFLQIK